MRSLKGKNVTWYDVVKPTEEDIAEIEKLHDIHPLIVEELVRTSSRTRIEHYDGYLFIVYHFPEYDPIAKTSRRTELDIIVTKNKIITVHYEQIKQLDSLFDYLAKDAKQRNLVLSGDSLLGVYYAFQRAISFSLRQLRHIEEGVAAVARDIFNGKEEELLKEISSIKRNIIDYRLIIHSNEKFFAQLHEIGQKFWGKRSAIYTATLINEDQPVHRNLANYYETIESLETTNAQLLDAETNRVMKKFTVSAFLASLPLYFVFFSEFQYIHEILASTPARFWTSFTIVHLIVLSLWMNFKRKKIL